MNEIREERFLHYSFSLHHSFSAVMLSLADMASGWSLQATDSCMNKPMHALPTHKHTFHRFGLLIPSHTHTHTYTHTHTHLRTRTYSHTYTHLRTRTYSHTYTHMYTHSYTHTYAHTQTHTFKSTRWLWTTCWKDWWMQVCEQFALGSQSRQVTD